MRKYLIIGATIAAALGAVPACGDDDDASCGDGYCGALETCSSCPGDCGTCFGCGDGICGAYESCTSCPTDCGSCTHYCGDGTCDWDEDCTACDRDCGACACTNALCTSGSTLCCPGGNPGTWNPAIAHCDCFTCTTSDDCGVSDICILNRCESAWGRAYRVTAVNAIFPAGIDSDDTVPDCYVITTIAGTSYTSVTVDEDYTPSWDYSFNATLLSTSTFTFAVYDWDPFDDDLLFYRRTGETSISVEWLRDGAVRFSNTEGTSQINYAFEPL